MPIRRNVTSSFWQRIAEEEIISLKSDVDRGGGGVTVQRVSLATVACLLRFLLPLSDCEATDLKVPLEFATLYTGSVR